MNACPNCNYQKTEPFFHLKNSPILQNILLATESAARGVEKIDVDFEYCPNCHFVFNPKFDESSVNYTEIYDNNQMGSPEYTNYIDGLTDRIVADCSLNSDSKILEIGCGNGYFLSQIKEKSSSKFVRGYDPTYNGQHHMSEFINKSYFQPEAGETFEWIALRHALEGMLNYDGVLTGILASMHRKTKLYLEIVNLDYIIKQKDLSLLYYECARYYSLRSLQQMLSKYNLEIQQVYSLFNDNYLGVFASKRPDVRDLAEVRTKLKETVPNYNKVVIWGIAGRAISTMAHFGWEPEVVQYGVDIDRNKQGKHIPVTGQLILSPEEAVNFQPQLVIVANANYLTEIKQHFDRGTKFLTLDGVLH